MKRKSNEKSTQVLKKLCVENTLFSQPKTLDSAILYKPKNLDFSNALRTNKTPPVSTLSSIFSDEQKKPESKLTLNAYKRKDRKHPRVDPLKTKAKPPKPQSTSLTQANRPTLRPAPGLRQPRPRGERTLRTVSLGQPLRSAERPQLRSDRPLLRSDRPQLRSNGPPNNPANKPNPIKNPYKKQRPPQPTKKTSFNIPKATSRLKPVPRREKLQKPKGIQKKPKERLKLKGSQFRRTKIQVQSIRKNKRKMRRAPIKSKPKNRLGLLSSFKKMSDRDRGELTSGAYVSGNYLSGRDDGDYIDHDYHKYKSHDMQIMKSSLGGERYEIPVVEKSTYSLRSSTKEKAPTAPEKPKTIIMKNGRFVVVDCDISPLNHSNGILHKPIKLLKKCLKVLEDDPLPFPCQEDGCVEVFKTYADLRRHCDRFHLEWRCKICGVIYEKESSLRIHERKHRGEHGHQCMFCKETSEILP